MADVPASPRSPAPEPACDARDRPNHWHWIAIGVTILLFALLLWLLPTRRWIEQLIAWTEDFAPWGVLIYIILYAILAVLAVPVTPLNIGAGIFFGWGWGFVAALAGSLLSAGASFLIARFGAQDWVRGKLACHPKYAALLRNVKQEGWKLVLLIRLNPVVPASVKNYCFGVTTIRFTTYILATGLAQIPIVGIYTYLGSAGYLTLRREGESLSTAQYVLYGAGAVLAIGLTGFLTWYGKKRLDALERKYPSESAPPRPADTGAGDG